MLFGNLNACTICAQLPAISYPRSPTDDFAHQHSEKQKLLKLKNLGTLTPRKVSPSVEEAQRILLGDGRCFTINHISVEGVHHIKKRTITKVIDLYAGKCIELFDIQILIKKLTKIYLDRLCDGAFLYSGSRYKKQQDSQICSC